MASKKGPGLRIKTEVIIILVFFLSFIVWSVKKCSAKKQSYTSADTEHNTPSENPKAESPSSSSPTEGVNAPIIKTVYATKLYVSIDGLKLRRGPTVDSPFIARLPLFDELIFLNEVSDSTDIISLAEGIEANEPWVKVRNRQGMEGWVYGAGVHYYKMKYPGLE
ncbi:MAG TPA: SH3 domain-containing protein [Phaeodactylibacter sp.]|nr:SH3 domain-containing protein [Phaeodactylibacter sp.]